MATKKNYSTTMPSWLNTGGIGSSTGTKKVAPNPNKTSTIPTKTNTTTTSSGGGSSSTKVNGSSGGNSQYTAPTLGNTWDANTDYQAIINNAVANRDYVTAAKAEQLRNQKIVGTGSDYATTNNYSSYLNTNNGGSSGGTYVPTGTYNDRDLSNDAKAEIETYKQMYNEAIAVGDMERATLAHNMAEAIRRENGYTGGDDGSEYIPIQSGYTPVGTHNDKDLPGDVKNLIDGYKTIYNNAMASGDINTANAAHAMAEALRKEYGYSGGDDGSEYLKLPDAIPEPTPNVEIPVWNEDDYEVENPKPTTPERDPRIERLLNEILNRDDFDDVYNVLNDPLYKQYKESYTREGDRAMRNTLAEAAAGAGGMNTYAITAAQQAQNNYMAQLNDKIPELYQLAYQMYINEKESKVQDLGILQDMDATQYNRYRDTINDYYKDKDFAYNVYYDALQQSNWNKTFDYNSMWDQKTFDNDNYWKGQEMELKKDEISYNRDKYDEETSYNKDIYNQESAQKQAQYWIELGVMPDLATIEAAGWNVDVVREAVASVKAALAKKNKSSDGDSGLNKEYSFEVTKKDEDWLRNVENTKLPNSGNYSSVQAKCEELLAKEGKSAVLKMLGEVYAAGGLDTSSFMNLYGKYRG